MLVTRYCARSCGERRCWSSSGICRLVLSRWKPVAALIFWGREISKLDHDVRLIPPAYVKPFVKRQKNDAADAEAICEAAVRPTMPFVPVKSEDTQGAAMVFRVRELLTRQRTHAINALRGHLAEFGRIVPRGAANASKLIAFVEDPENGIPADAITTLKVLVIGANSVIIKHHVHAAARPGTWSSGVLSRKPPMLVRVALANKMGALMARGGVYKAPATAA